MFPTHPDNLMALARERYAGFRDEAANNHMIQLAHSAGFVRIRRGNVVRLLGGGRECTA